MASAVLQHENFDSTPQVRSSVAREKTNSLTNGSSVRENAFRDLIKEKPKQSSPVNTESPESKKISTTKQSEAQETIEFVGPVEETLNVVETLEITNLQLGAEHFSTPKAIEFEEEGEQVIFSTEDEELPKGAELAEEIVVPFIAVEQLTVPVVAEIVSSEVIAPVNDNIVSIEPSVNTIIAPELSVDTLQISKLPPEEQALLQSMKIVELPEGFKLETSAVEMEFDITTSAKPVITAFASEEITQLDSLLKGMKGQLEVTSGDPAKETDVETILKQVLTASNNVVLADNTRQGQSVLSKMHSNNPSKNSVESSAASMIGESEIVAEAEEIGTNLGGNNNSASKHASSAFTAAGGVIENNTEDFFQMSFKENMLMSAKGDAMPKPAMQVSLAVTEALNASTASGKKTVIINLFPEALGPIRVEVLSVAGKDGVRQIESIKFIADKRETLAILEAAKEKFIELTTKATDIKEEASLEFEMNQGERGQKAEYFANAEERDRWMSQFSDLSNDDGLAMAAEAAQEDVGYITEDSVNIKV